MYKILMLLFLLTHSYASTLKSTYFINSHNIKLQDIIPGAPYNLTLYKIQKNKHSKRVKSKDLVKLLHEHGFKNIKSSSAYIQFKKNSPIDTNKIKASLRAYYEDTYKNIHIKAIEVTPRAYITSLPKNFQIKMQKKAYLSNKGILSIKTTDNKKIFFDFFIDASIDIYQARNTIHKSTKLNTLNTIQKKIKFEKFRAMPISTQHFNTSQSKRKLQAKSILTTRDITTLYLIKRNASVNVQFEDKNINISFLAKALQNGKLNDIITVQKHNKKRLKVKIIGKNRVEIQ